MILQLLGMLLAGVGLGVLLTARAYYREHLRLLERLSEAHYQSFELQGMLRAILADPELYQFARIEVLSRGEL